MLPELSANDCISIIADANSDMQLITEKKKILDMQHKTVENVTAWMRDAIQKDYKPPVKHRFTTQFSDFEQRDYDFVALENKLFGL